MTITRDWDGYTREAFLLRSDATKYTVSQKVVHQIHGDNFVNS